MIWSLGLWWIWKVANEHKKKKKEEEHGTRVPSPTTKSPLLVSLRFWPLKRKKKIAARWKRSNTERFYLPVLSLMAVFASCLELWRGAACSPLFERLKKGGCVKGNSRLLSHWPDDDVPCCKMARNKLMSSRQEGCTKRSDSSGNNAADDHRMLKDPHFEV